MPSPLLEHRLDTGGGICLLARDPPIPFDIQWFRGIMQPA